MLLEVWDLSGGVRAATGVLPGLLITLFLFLIPFALLLQSRSVTFSEVRTGVDGYTIHYRIGGEGPYLLMLHGFTLTGDQWMPAAAQLSAKYTVIVPDLPGHGGSSPLPGEFSFARTAELIHSLLDSLGVAQISAVGHSGGGMSLLHMAAQQPERFLRMVLVASTPSFGETAREFIREDTFERLDPAVQRYYTNLHPGGKAQVETMYRQYLRLAENTERIDRDILENLEIPTLIVWGDRDPFFPVETAMEFYRTLPDAALWIVPWQEHTPLWEDMGGNADATTLFPGMLEQFLPVSQMQVLK